MSEGWFDPLNEDVDQSDITTADTEHREAADALLVGRNTFESFRGFWPRQTDDPTGVSDYLNAVNKYVVSSTLDDPGWENSTVLRGPVIDEVLKLKEEPGRNKYRLFVFPVVVGRGARQFESANVKLKLLETQPFVSGAVLLRYAEAGRHDDA
jgi:dihydrofolate reductase